MATVGSTTTLEMSSSVVASTPADPVSPSKPSAGGPPGDPNIKKVSVTAQRHIKIVVDAFGEVKFIKDLSKVGYAVHDVPALFHQMPEGFKNWASVCRYVKNFIGVTEMPGKVYEFYLAVSEKFDTSTAEKTALSVGNLVSKTVDLYQPVHDGMTLLNSGGVVQIPSEVLRISGSVSAGALWLVSAYEITKNSVDMAEPCDWIVNSKLSEAKTDKEIKQRMEIVEKGLIKAGLHMINIAKFVSYIALATIVILAFFAVAIATGWFVFFATAALVFSLTGYFYDKFFKPKEITAASLPLPLPVTHTIIDRTRDASSAA